MRITFLLLTVVLISWAFVKTPKTDDIYELSVQAGGCHYQISMNDKILMDGKSYQVIEKKIRLNGELTDENEQQIDINMFRISREMSLKATNAFINLKLEKITKDTTVLVKELKLPTFSYDDDEEQPQSISGSIHFKLHKPEPESESAEEKKIEKPTTQSKKSGFIKKEKAVKKDSVS